MASALERAGGFSHGVRVAARKVVGVLIDYLDSWQAGYETQLRGAFQAECDRHGLNLLLVVGRAVEHPDPSSRAHNDLYRLLHRDCIDALILVGGGLASVAGVPGLERLVRTLPAVPLCCVGLEVPDVPSVMVEARSGMTELMVHLLREHGRRNVAFIGGPANHPEAVVRREVYEHELLRHGLEVDRRLIVDASFTRPSGMDAMREILAREVPFDAVVVANDAMALGAMDVLRSKGYLIPRDVAVTGFDDLQLARYAAVPLTTVRQPVEYMAKVAVTEIRRQLQGEQVQPVQRLVAKFVQRQSCGCGAPRVQRPERSVPSGTPLAKFVRDNAAELTALLNSDVVLPVQDRDWAALLVQSLGNELNGKQDAFISALDELLNTIVYPDELYDEFQHVITALREALSDVATPELEELWHTARRQIAVASIRNQTAQRMDAEAAYRRLLNTAERFTAALDRDALLRALAEELPRMNARDVFISLFAPGDRSHLVPFFAMREGKVLPTTPEPFPATRLVPDPSYLREGGLTAFAFPLTFESENLGVVVFRAGADVYEMLREQISAALKVHALHQEIVHQTALHERTLQERLATAERMHSLSVLAGGVAHDLNNALGPLVGLPDMISSDLVRVQAGDAQRAAQVREDLALIKQAAQRAANTIKDLLTLGRRGNVPREALDINEVVRQYIASEPVQQHAQHAQVVLQVALCPTALGVSGSEGHLVRAVSNLLRNALEATAPGGSVTLHTAALDVHEALHGYETVEPGSYAVVRVSDTGHGMSHDDLTRAFEPFFTKKRYGGRSGSGLGLAIVHAVTKEHEGFIHVESQLERGTTFTLYLPRIALAERPPASAPTLRRGGGRVLVVDDEPAQLHTAARTLSALGYEVVTAPSAEQARIELGLLRGEGASSSAAGGGSGFALVLCDVVLGDEGDGVELLRSVLATYPGQKTLAVSGYASEDLRRAADALGIPWVSKPYTVQVLAEAVARVLES